MLKPHSHMLQSNRAALVQMQSGKVQTAKLFHNLTLIFMVCAILTQTSIET